MSFTKAKASLTGSEVDKLLPKLVEAASAGSILSQPHPHRKCKGISGSPSPVHSQVGHLQLSSHQVTATANKRVSGQFALWPPLCSPEDLSSSGSSMSRAGNNDEKLVVGDIDNTPKTLLVAKDATSMAVEDRRIAIAGAACEAKAVREKRGAHYFLRQGQGARTVFKVYTPRPKMAEAINGTVVLILGGHVTAPKVSITHWFHPHKQFKGIPGLSSLVQPPALRSQPSPQQRSVTANRRVSIQAFLWLFLHSPEYLSSSESYTSVSGDNNKILVGEVTDKEIKTPFGDWNSYLFFTQGADSQLQGNSLSSIWVDDWRSLQSNNGDSSVPLSSVAVVGTPGGWPVDGPKDSGRNSLGHNLCNKTDVDPIESLPFIGPGTVFTAIPHCAPPRTVSLATAL